MVTFSPGEYGFASVILTGAVLDALVDKGVVSTDEAKAIIRKAHLQCFQATDPLLGRAQEILKYLYEGSRFDPWSEPAKT